MREYLPLLIAGGIIGVFATLAIVAYCIIRRQKEDMTDRERHMSDREIITRLLRYAKPYWKSFVAVGIIMLFSIAYEVASPLLMGAIQGLVKQENFQLSRLYSTVAVYAGILIVSLICTYLQAMILQKTGQKILSRIRLDVFTHAEKLSHGQLNEIPVGKLVTRVTNDPNAISHMFTNIMASKCLYGCINNGGNNVFVNCGFNSNITGFLIDNSRGQSNNNSHGSAIGCTFNHSGNPQDGCFAFAVCNPHKRRIASAVCIAVFVQFHQRLAFLCASLQHHPVAVSTQEVPAHSQAANRFRLVPSVFVYVNYQRVGVCVALLQHARHHLRCQRCCKVNHEFHLSGKH